jgi:uncharacterized protein DUF7002
MGVTPDELAAFYPYLYHMAEPGTWESICRHGLLSTSSLLTLFEFDGEARRPYEERKREESVEINHPCHGRAVLRDQKPIIESKLKFALQDCTLTDWYKLLNSRVFFWLSIDRLNTLLSARQYRGKPHTILTLETLPLALDYEASITLSPMNSGNTLPVAHPRGLATFRRMKDYPFAERLKYGPYYTVVELAVEGGVPDVCKYVVRSETMTSDGATSVTSGILYSR